MEMARFARVGIVARVGIEFLATAATAYNQAMDELTGMPAK